MRLPSEWSFDRNAMEMIALGLRHLTRGCAWQVASGTLESSGGEFNTLYLERQTHFSWLVLAGDASMIDRGLFELKTNLNLIIYQLASDLRGAWYHRRLNDYTLRGVPAYGKISSSVKVTDARWFLLTRSTLTSGCPRLLARYGFRNARDYKFSNK